MTESHKTELYKKVEEFVKDSFTSDGMTSSTFDHQVETAEWVRKLHPDADEALIIAALGHDIERASRGEDMYIMLKDKKDGFKDKNFLNEHQLRGAKIISDFLKTQNADLSFIDRVNELILFHEVGGTADSDLLKDADSLSFFNTRVSHFIKTKTHLSSVEKVKSKIDWMFDRITSEKARNLAKPLYEKAIKELENV